MQTYGTYNVAGEKIHTHKKITKHTMPLIRHNKPCDYPKTVLEGQKGGPEYKEKASRARQSKACVSWKETDVTVGRQRRWQRTKPVDWTVSSVG